MANTTTDAEPEVRINVALPAAVHRAVKSRAALEGIPMKDAVVAVLAEWGEG